MLTTKNKLAVIIPVYRKPSLTRVLSYYLANEEVGEVIVVDFDYDFSYSHDLYGDATSCSKGARILSVEREQYFNKSKALNIGAHICSSPLLLFCDADVLIPPDTVNVMKMTIYRTTECFVTIKSIRETDTGAIRVGFGQCALSRELFLKVQGYTSDFRGWGSEDNDFVHRLLQAGAHRHDYGQADHISHSESERVQGYRGNCRKTMQRHNRKLLDKRMAAGVVFGTMVNDVRKTAFCEVETLTI